MSAGSVAPSPARSPGVQRECLVLALVGPWAQGRQRLAHVLMEGLAAASVAGRSADPAARAEPVTPCGGHFLLVAPRGPARWPVNLRVEILDVPLGHPPGRLYPPGWPDAALLPVPAVNDPLPLLDESLRVLYGFGLRAVMLVVLGETPLTSEALETAAARLRELLRDGPFARAAVETLLTGHPRGLTRFQAGLADWLVALPRAHPPDKPRLWIESAEGAGGGRWRMAGLLAGGELQRGLEVTLHPGDITGVIERLEIRGVECASAAPGQRIAVTLECPDHASGGAFRALPHSISGSVLFPTELGPATDTVDVLLERAPSPFAGAAPSSWLPGDRASVEVGCATGIESARVFLHRADAAPDGGALAQLRLESPRLVWGGDRLVIRAGERPDEPVAARVLDPEGDRKRWQRRDQVSLLAARAAAPDDVRVWLGSQLRRDGFLPRAGLLKRTLFAARAVEAALRSLVAEHAAVLAGDWVADTNRWEELRERVAALVDQAHAAHPERPGAPFATLRAALAETLPDPDLADRVIQGLAGHGFVRAGDALARAAHRPALPLRLQPAAEWIRQVLRETPLAPLSRGELTREPPAAEALQFLIHTGEVVDVGPTLVLSRPAYQELVTRIRTELRRRGRATVSELRQAVGCSRRILIPVCEKLEREGVTRRAGDYHELRRAPAAGKQRGDRPRRRRLGPPGRGHSPGV